MTSHNGQLLAPGGIPEGSEGRYLGVTALGERNKANLEQKYSHRKSRAMVSLVTRAGRAAASSSMLRASVSALGRGRRELPRLTRSPNVVCVALTAWFLQYQLLFSLASQFVLLVGTAPLLWHRTARQGPGRAVCQEGKGAQGPAAVNGCSGENHTVPPLQWGHLGRSLGGPTT